MRRLIIEGDHQGFEGSENTPHHTALVALITAIVGKNGDVPNGLQVQKLNDWLTDVDVEFIYGTDIEASAKQLLS